MTERPLKNVAHSVHQRLLNEARDSSRPFNELLQYYAMERFLYRLSVSPHADRFVLKGALMWVAWRGPATRPTRDIDLLGRMSNEPGYLAATMRDICTQEVKDDGLVFDAETVRTSPIARNADYQGVRVRLEGRLGNAVVHIQVDVGFGDQVTPPEELDYPTILDMPAPSLRGYSRESAIAEKLHAMFKLGALNSRIRDFYDIWLLSRQFRFEGGTLGEAIQGTFATRDTEIEGIPMALTKEFAEDRTKQQLWRSFLRKSRIEGPAELSVVIADVAAFVGPVLEALSGGHELDINWHPARGWQ